MSASRGTPAPRPSDARDGTRTGADLLRIALAGHGLPVSKDLVSAVGTGGTTLWTLNAAQTLVVAATTRTSVVDDAFLTAPASPAVSPFDHGRIAASAALTAVHATAATPLFARLTLACPTTVGDAARQSLVDGVAVAMSAAGAVLADVEIVEASALRFDVLVCGLVRPDRLRGPMGAAAGDSLILTGVLGGGIYAAAHARRKLTDDDRRALVAGAAQANRVGVALGAIRNVHAVRAVGPDGLLAAVLALAAAADLTASLSAAPVPALPRALELARDGAVAPESSRNWNRDGARVALADAVMPQMRSLLTDPVTSGVLLIACKADSADRVLTLCRADGARAAVIGTLATSKPAAPAPGSARRSLEIGP